MTRSGLRAATTKLNYINYHFRFKIKEYLELHLRNKHSNFPLKARQKTPCSMCGKILSSLVALRNHEEKHLLELHPGMQVKKFVCDYCGQSFRMKSYLFNHMHNIHFRRKYPCAICSKGFYKKYEMHGKKIGSLGFLVSCGDEQSNDKAN